VVSLQELFARCSIVTNHAPSTPETRRMIGTAAFAAMHEGALFVNTARSWSVDPEALLGALRSGRISAALDVFDEEPLPAGSPFRALDNVILTPHIAGATVEARLRQGDLIAAEVRRFCAGQPMRYEVTAQQLEIMA
jgi:phosphoglycerate dehydrogenase-like enzyme